MAENWTRWALSDRIDAPCADMHFSYLPGQKLRVLMHFSKVIGGLEQDLEVILNGGVALRWAEEALHSVTSPIVSLPKLSSEKWSDWTYPLLLVEESEWLKSVKFFPHVRDHRHMVFMSMNDVIEVLAKPDADIQWISP